MPNRREYYEYITATDSPVVTLQQYQEKPATAFLSAIVDAKCAVDLCCKTFRTTRRGKLSKPAQRGLQIINASLLAYIMGHFETYQKYLFAQMFEYSVYLNKFSVESFIKKLSTATKCDINIGIVGFAGYRDCPTGVGLVLAENLHNWQSPRKVNEYFQAFDLKDNQGRPLQFLSNDDEKDLAILWQMRHSIVHTANTITLPDSQKVERLRNFGNRTIILDKSFILEVVRKFHPMIKQATERMESVYIHNVSQNLSQPIQTKISNLFKVTSSCNVWLRNA